jgi:PAS domain S-box-containing protein
MYMSKERTISSTKNQSLSLTRTAAKASEKGLVSVLESMGDAFVLVDKDYTILRLNKMQEKLSRVKRKDALGKNFWDVYDYAAGFDSPCWTNYQKAMKTKRPVHFVHYSEPHDLWTEIDAYPTDTGGLSIFLRDISDRKRAEEAVRYSQNNLAYLAEVSTALSLSLNLEDIFPAITKLAVPHISDWCAVDMLNDAGDGFDAVAIAHSDPKKMQLVKKHRELNPIDMNAPFGLPAIVKNMKPEFHPLITDELLVSVAKSKQELKLLRSIGMSSALSVPLIVRGKGIGAITFVTSDSQKRLTENDLQMAQELANRAATSIENANLYQEIKKSRDELEEQKRLYEAVTENTPDLVYVFDMNYRFTFANDALLQMWGKKTLDEAKGKGLRELGYEEWHAAMHEREIEEIKQTKKSVRGTVSFPHAVLGKRVYDYLLSPVLGKDDNVVAVAGITRDITDIKKAEDEFRELLAVTEQRNALLKINKTKDEFIGMASHQLRTPATAVKQYLALVLGGIGGELSDDHKKYLQIAYDSNERELDVINDLLRTAQLDSSEYMLDLKKQDIKDILCTCIANMNTAFNMRGQNIKFKPCENPAYVKVDASEMRLVFVNLLENASKYSHRGSTVDVTIKEKNGYVNVAFIDRGVGIDEDDHERIFEKFTRVDNALSDTVAGTGLGLFWVKHIVEKHGGTIDVKSTHGKGSTFTVRLPK